ncbi:MAG TPA: DegT/DnrJ/EryC1/StrS family aminotransferase [Pyrinomonadaceae bacterium]
MAGPGLELIGAEEMAEVMAVIESCELSRYRFDDHSAKPSKVFAFERALEKMMDVRHCLGMNSCTSALLTGLWAAGIGPGAEVIVPGYTFVASIAAIAYAGATPVLAEIDASLNLDPDDVRRRITPRTRGIMAVHMMGSPCDLNALTSIAHESGLLLFEDCAQAAGGLYRGRALGTFGTFGCFSLNVFKTFTAGDGGVLLTNDTQLYERAFAIHDHGARPNRVGVADANSLLGLNFRMHELTGAVAGAQLQKLPAILARLREQKAKLRAAIGEVPQASERVVHDVEGECATVLAYTFENADVAHSVAKNLGTITLASSGKHNYANIPQLARCAIPGRARPVDVHAEPGMLPRTDDLLARTIALSVGVVDSYLGTAFGINIGSDDNEIAQVAEKFLSAVKNAEGKR